MTDKPQGPFVLQKHRAFSSPTVTFGPFAELEDALAWMDERDLPCVIVQCVSPDADTGTTAECWQ